MSRAYAVSGDGSTVVGRASSGSGREAFIWDVDNGMQGLGDLAGGRFFSHANSVSSDGSTVVGRGFTAAGTEAFIWDADNGMRGLGEMAGGGFGTEADGVSGDGATVVGRGISPSGSEAFIWDAENGMQGLGDLAGGNFQSLAFGVSTDGSTVVGRGFSAFGPQAFIWDVDNGMRDLGDLAGGGPGSEANGVSSDGSTVVGWSYSASGPEAFIWKADSGMQGLGDLGGVPNLAGVPIFESMALAVSGDGSTVVGHGQSLSGQEAFIWNADSGMRSLQVLLTMMGVDLTGWQLVSAEGVSADGRVIVGWGTNPSGLTEAFIAVVPEPGSALLLGLGLVGLGLCRGRAALAGYVAGQVNRPPFGRRACPLGDRPLSDSRGRACGRSSFLSRASRTG